MVIRIPIEVQTSESTEIRELLDRIDRAEGKLSIIRTAIPGVTQPGRTDAATLLGFEQTPQTGITRDTSSFSRNALGVSEVSRRSPLGTPTNVSEAALPRGRGGIMRGAGGPQDIARENQFAALREDVNNLEQQITTGTLLGGQIASDLGTVLGGRPGSLLIGAASKILPPVLILLLAKQVTESVLEFMLQPGGPWDRRFKRDFEKEYNTLRSREQKGLLRTGQQEIRLSYGPIGKRAKAYDVSTTLSNVKSGQFPAEQLSYAVIGVP